ncbi:hypothetical protein KIPB_002297 [Kipferlia bialata]|uniref:AMP-dependent synthetase/ligase domain-containing protein n=1 Tax=Kipferlia bialata TaxID=797122 RepID=A0A9K3CS91_9EUKA|nr:hypothetical protein KIPB_002297 [Kipferlia bialata]|eukprot:g2297.t1
MHEILIFLLTAIVCYAVWRFFPRPDRRFMALELPESDPHQSEVDQAKLERCRTEAESLTHRSRMCDWIDYHAKTRPNEIALIEHDTDSTLTWAQLSTATKAFAAQLMANGIGKGDVVATTLVLLKEHIYVMYACYRIGAIIAPLDPRLKLNEIREAFDAMNPKAYLYLGLTSAADFRKAAKVMMVEHPETSLFVQFQGKGPDGEDPESLIIEGAVSATGFAQGIKGTYIRSLVSGSLDRAMRRVSPTDPCLIVFTTGSTGKPKPALLTHRGILCQSLSLACMFGVTQQDRILANLPPSHVGCLCEVLGLSAYCGNSMVVLHMFTPEGSLEAIQKHKVTALGQIPALYRMEWRHKDYAQTDISSMRFAVHGGSMVDAQFIDDLRAMAPEAGTGLGLTETSGFCTYTPTKGTAEELAASVGHASPMLAMSIRTPLSTEGTSTEVMGGEIGEVCFKGPQVFAGYYKAEAETLKCMSNDGWLHTGDLGTIAPDGLHLKGRSKFVVRQKGYQVYPPEIEDFVTKRVPEVAQAVVVGSKHAVYGEGIVLFVEAEGHAEAEAEGDADYCEGVVKAVHAVCKEMAAYKRPLHVVVHGGPGSLPLNRVSKIDRKALTAQGEDVVQTLRTEGGWDA